MNLVSFVGLLGKLGLVAGALTFLLGIGSAGGEDPAFSKEKNDEYLRGRKPEDKDTGVSGFMRRYLPTWMTGVGLTPSVVTPGQVIGQTAPGAGTVNQGDNTVNLNVGGVTVNAVGDDSAGALTKVFDNAAKTALDALARQAKNAAPKTEAATQ
jgi:hypothetical protein